MSDLNAKYNQVETLINDGKYEEAIVGLNEIVQADDSFVIAHLALARAYTKTGQHESAVQHAEKACQLEPDDFMNFTALSVTYQQAWAGTQDQTYITKAEDAMARAQQLS